MRNLVRLNIAMWLPAVKSHMRWQALLLALLEKFSCDGWRCKESGGFLSLAPCSDFSLVLDVRLLMVPGPGGGKLAVEVSVTLLATAAGWALAVPPLPSGIESKAP
jgi:hypothetical protein